MDISKHITAIKQLIINRLPKKWQSSGRERSDSYDGIDDDLEEEDLQPGNISMTDGEKDKTLGINKKFVNIALMASALIILVAFAYNIMDGDGYDKQNNGQMQKNEQAADPNMAKRQALETDYRDVQAQMQMANQQKTGNTGANGSRSAGNVQNMQPAGTQQQVPAIRATQQPQQSYSAPYMLPSALAQIDANARRNAPNQSINQDAAEAKNKETKALVDKFRSAIDFAIGGGGVSTADNANSAGSTVTANMGNYSAGYSAPGGMILQAGTIIPMMLYTGINTDNPGQVIAQVQSDVYDTATGTTLLIPMGTKAIGSYQGGAGNSDRVAITFSTLVFPNGGSFSIGNSMVAVDDQGYNGIRGSMNKHMDAAIGRTLVNGVLSAGFTALSTIGANRANIDTSGLQQLLQSSTNIQPTITVEPGYEFNIFVTQPISFSF